MQKRLSWIFLLLLTFLPCVAHAGTTSETIFFLSDDLKSAVSYYNSRNENSGNHGFFFDKGYDKKLIMYARPENYRWVDDVFKNKNYDKLLFPQTHSYGYLRRHANADAFLEQVGPTRYRLYIDGSKCMGDSCLMDENIIVAVLPKKLKVVDYSANVKGNWKTVGNTYTFYSSNIQGASVEFVLDDVAPNLYVDLSRDLAKFKGIDVEYEGNNVKVTMPLEGMFLSGQASIQGQAKPWLDTFIQKVKQTDLYELRVEGHTDNVPIKNPAQSGFQSNWELSSARAASAVRYFIAAGMDPKILAAVGYADSRPVADNATAEGRMKNRRIEFTVVTSAPNQAREDYKSQWDAI